MDEIITCHCHGTPLGRGGGGRGSNGGGGGGGETTDVYVILMDVFSSLTLFTGS